MSFENSIYTCLVFCFFFFGETVSIVSVIQVMPGSPHASGGFCGQFINPVRKLEKSTVNTSLK